MTSFINKFNCLVRGERLALQTERVDLEAEMAADLNVKSLEGLGYGA